MKTLARIVLCGILSVGFVAQVAVAATPCSVELGALKRAQSKTRTAEKKLSSAERLVEKEKDRKADKIDYFERKQEAYLNKSRGLQDQARGCYSSIPFGQGVTACLRLEFKAKQVREYAEGAANNIVTYSRIADGKIARAQTKLDAALAVLVTTTTTEAKAQESYDLCITAPTPTPTPR